MRGLVLVHVELYVPVMGIEGGHDANDLEVVAGHRGLCPLLHRPVPPA